MKAAHLPADENSRLEALHEYEILDTQPDTAFDDLTALAAHLCGAPMSLVSFVDRERQWFKSRVGVSLSETPRHISFCAHALHESDLFVVPDACRDDRFADNPLVTSEPGIRFYAGAPLISATGGAVLGTLCVMDRVPRQLTEAQSEALRALGRQVMTQLELLRQTRELMKRERRLRAIFDTEPECVKLLADDGSLLEMNPAGLRMIEAGSFREVEGRCIYPLVVEAYRRPFKGLTERVFAGESGTLQFEVIGLKGTRRWLETHATPLRSDNGAVAALLGITRDVTDRKLAEDSLRQSEQRFAQMFYSSPMALLLGRFRDRAIVDVNSAFESLTGHSREMSVGRTFGELGILADHVREHYGAELRATGRFLSDEIPFRRRTGEERTVIVSGEQLMIYDEPHALMSIVDVTERNAALERLREVVENIQEVFWITDPGKTAMLYVSPAYERIWGRTCQSLYEQPDSWIASVHPEDRDRIAHAVHEKQAAGDYNDTYRIVRSDGSVRWIHERAFPVRGDHGEVLRIVGTAIDITDQRQLEDQFRQAQKMESVGRLAGGIAHDFNNLLTVINGMADLALAGLNERDPLRADLEEIQRAGVRAAAMTRQLLALSRQQILKPQVINLTVIVRGLQSMLRRLIGEDVNLAVTLSDELGNVMADPGQVEQILLNLAVNARDAMPDGGRLTIATENVELDATFAGEHVTVNPGPHVQLAVSDTGCGMDEATRQRIFEPFYTTKAPGKGTGLGLSTVYGIVKQSGGTVWVYSEPNHGTTFRIYFPRVDQSPQHEQPPGIATTMRGTETILLVEDEDALRHFTIRVLESSGYTVLDARNGAEALRLLDHHEGPMDLLLTDIVMPGMNGRELAARLGALHPEMRVVFTSGYTDDAILRHRVLDDAAQFLGKPFTPAELRRKVRDTLDR